MSTSGTTTFNPEQSDLIEDAASMAGTELRTGYDFRMARFALNLLMQEWANRGFNLWTVSSATTALIAATDTYTLPADTIDVIEVGVRTGADITTRSDIIIRRVGVSAYAAIPNKLSQGRPVQYYVSRVAAPSITLWPIPDQTSVYTLYYYYLRRLQDAGNAADYTQDVPHRFVPALVAGLAYHIALRKPELAARAAPLKAAYEEQWDLAAGEDRERASVRFVPRIGRI